MVVIWKYFINDTLFVQIERRESAFVVFVEVWMRVFIHMKGKTVLRVWSHCQPDRTLQAATCCVEDMQEGGKVRELARCNKERETWFTRS
jgi:hypothetical protein